MCMDMLRKLVNSELPLCVADTYQIDLVRVLDAAGCIEAVIPAAHLATEDGEGQDPATVLKITAHGRRKLIREASRRTGLDSTALAGRYAKADVTELPSQE